VTPSSGHAEARQIFVITHLDIIPTFVDQARPVLVDAPTTRATGRSLCHVAVGRVQPLRVSMYHRVANAGAARDGV